MSKPQPALVLGHYKKRIETLLDESAQMLRKERYTANKVYQILKAEGYQGSAGGIHNYISRLFIRPSQLNLCHVKNLINHDSQDKDDH